MNLKLPITHHTMLENNNNKLATVNCYLYYKKSYSKMNLYFLVLILLFYM